MRILGIGTATPEFAFTQQDRFEVAESFMYDTDQARRVLPTLIEKAGVEKRYSCLLKSSAGSIAERQTLYRTVQSEDANPSTEKRMQVFSQEAIQLAEQSVQQVMTKTTCDAREITHLVTVSCTGFSAPGFDLQLLDSAGLPRGVERVNVGFMGCHGGLNGLRVASAIANSDPQAKVLLCATELCTLHYQYSGNTDQLIANSLFADGSMALVGEAACSTSLRSTSGWRVAGSASYVIPGSADLMSWMISDTGFRMSLSPALPSLIQQRVFDWMCEWLRKYDLTPEQIRGWAVHPGGPKILSSFQAAMSISREDLVHSYDVLREYGNMSSATVFFILQRMIDEGDRLPCVALGFGPGITIEAALLMPE